MARSYKRWRASMDKYLVSPNMPLFSPVISQGVSINVLIYRWFESGIKPRRAAHLLNLRYAMWKEAKEITDGTLNPKEPAGERSGDGGLEPIDSQDEEENTGAAYPA